MWIAGEENKDEEKKDESHMALMLKTRTVVIAGQIDQEVAEKAIGQLLFLDAHNHDPIKVIITSQGGHVDSGYAIHDMMRFIESPVISIGAGWVASIAVPILFGASKENRYSLKNTRFLIHQPSGGAGGQAADIRIDAQEISKLRERINKLISDETGQTIEKVAADSERNFWMSAEEALKYGLIKKVVTTYADLS